MRTRVLDVLLRAAGPGVKRGVLNRTVQRVAAAILRSPLSSKDPIHFGTLGAVHRLNDLEDPLSEEAVLAIGRWVLRGRVLPLQRLVEIVGEARGAYLARCPCRASGRVRDLDAAAPLAAPASREARARDEALLAPVLEAWADPAVRTATAAPLAAILDRIAAAAAGADPGPRPTGLAELHRSTWPFWEILLEHPGYDRCWLDGLAANGKVWATHPRLLVPWIRALHGSRAVVFTHMEAAGLPYAICTCPGPESDGGCILTNWHYFSDNDEILLPNVDAAFGQRRDRAGAVLPCDRHPARAAKPCLGCGCAHAQDGSPRGGPGRSPRGD